jgi:PAS domain-containing protein
MTELIGKKDKYLQIVINTIPSAIFVIDYGFNIVDINPAAKELFGIDSDVTLRRLCGDIMHCMNAKESGGCGKSKFCPDCVVRNSVETASKGAKIHREKYKMRIEKSAEVNDIHMLITASNFEFEEGKYVLLVMEDITDVITLKSLLPICASCNKIRNDKNYWESVSEYLNKHMGVNFTHSLCPDCARKLYPGLPIY